MSTGWTLPECTKVNRQFIPPHLIDQEPPLIIPKNYIHPCGREYFAEDLKNESIHTCLRCNTEFANPFYQAPEPNKISMYDKIYRIIVNTFWSNTQFERIHID